MAPACLKKVFRNPSIFKIDRNYFLSKLKTSKRHRKFLAWSKTQSFLKPIPQLPASKMLKVASNLLSATLNFSQLVIILEPPKYGGSLFSSFGGLRGHCFQDMPKKSWLLRCQPCILDLWWRKSQERKNNHLNNFELYW